MKNTDIYNTEISLYRYINNTIGIKFTLKRFLIDLGDILNQNGMIHKLRSLEDHNELRSFKKENIPAALISCVAGENKAKILKKNNLIVIDIDGEDNEVLYNNVRREELKKQIFDLPFVFSCSVSCGGNGLFAIIPVKSIDDEEFVYHFMSLQQFFKDKFNLVIDKNCKNINRLRYASYDDNILIKPEDGETEVYTDMIRPFIKLSAPSKTIKFTNNNQQSNSDNLLDNNEFIYKLINNLIDDGYSANDYLDWLIEGFRLSTLDFGLDLFLKISRSSSNYTGDSDVEKKFNNCKKNSKISREDAVLHYFAEAKKRFGPDWILKIKTK